MDSRCHERNSGYSQERTKMRCRMYTSRVSRKPYRCNPSCLSPYDHSSAMPLRSPLPPSPQCEDPALQAKARALMPLGALQGAADRAAALAAALGPDAVAALGAGAGGAAGAAGGPDREELLARGLLAWFKTSFFTWVRAGGGRCAAGAGVRVAGHVSRLYRAQAPGCVTPGM